jgi:two-component system response regulator (stage 0 sporulation protein F)
MFLWSKPCKQAKEGAQMDLFQKLRNMKILVIDDDEWIRDSLELFFVAESCNLLALASAEEGIEVLAKQRYDIIICDYKLPGMDGLGFFKAIQKSHPNALKVLITAYGNENMANEATRIGIHDFIQKPLTTNAIEKSLASLIQHYEDKNGEIRPERSK